ncbi:MAG: hypothetical protein M2R45_05374 [Verrucomicrobia subdivision 3 bacterium]|nr:hypothetical protein [Limisphaerales bacterium]
MVEALFYLDHAIVERGGFADVEVEEVRTLLVADDQQVFKAFRNEKDCAITFSLQQGVRGFGGCEAHFDRR